MAAEQFDVIIVGAGISGIDMAYRLQERCRDRSFVMLEGRDRLGGTWDLFRYPGIRSDSDMHTLGFPFRPWTDEKSIADGPAILNYMKEAVADYGLEPKIRYGHRVVKAAWSTADACWTVTATSPQGPVELRCNFLAMCAGYYDYEQPYAPEFAGAEAFQGQIVHPQFWPDNLDYTGKRVVVIGSGATAVTLVPAMTDKAAHVTMLQRSPSYIASRPAKDSFANWLRGKLPARAAYGLTRWKNVLLQMYIFRRMRKYPEQAKAFLVEQVRQQLGPEHDVETHFTPRYNPWDQRLCLVPDADLFDAMKAGKAAVVTDHIERFTPTGILLKSGRELSADIIVTATGLKLRLLSGIEFSLDGHPFSFAGALQYKGMMFEGVPNFVSVFGYTNASWTLKADLVALYACRLLNTMRKRRLRQATPRNANRDMELLPMLDFSSGYIQRSADLLPRQGARAPWQLKQNYAYDTMMLRFGSVDDAMEFSNPEPKRAKAA